MTNSYSRLVACQTKLHKCELQFGQKPHRPIQWPSEFRLKELGSGVNPFGDIEPGARVF